ncbi:Probable intracellular septation protein A [Candidatus Erwinia haradaeae]|uniref:Inner membrane-spanning protein YciB n=1 Tax=Candidatus Erwinia haradaeae TaxID=1922217 RepID=A0A451DKJ8_9GAMM|nr:septation protein A [Candidatus Erwinia haradaeae]VFP87246.1 Probable intracellular septation protein A [Candidatus Erwinia haradaeae]
MKQCLDFLPLLVFFIIYKIYNIFIASSALIGVSAVVLFLKWLLYRTLDKMSLLTFFLVAILGGLTITLHNPDFIKWKVTIIDGIFSIALLFSHFCMPQSLMQKMLSTNIQLPEVIWRRLNLAWALFFLCCSVGNIYGIFYLSQDAWINFKVFGLSGLTLVFTLLSGIYIFRIVSKENH